MLQKGFHFWHKTAIDISFYRMLQQNDVDSKDCGYSLVSNSITATFCRLVLSPTLYGDYEVAVK